MLQQIGSSGNTLKTFKSTAVVLDTTTTVQRSTKDGVVSFPIQVTHAASGSYMLKFEPIVPNGRVLLTSTPFYVVNQVESIGSNGVGWKEVELEKFGVDQQIPKQLQFRVYTA